MPTAYRWTGNRIVLDGEGSEALQHVQNWEDLQDEEWRGVYGQPMYWNLPFLRVLRHTQSPMWRAIVFWDGELREEQPIVTAFDLITCNQMGEMLDCVEYLLAIVERMHRVEDIVGNKNRLWELRYMPEDLEARARLLAAGYTLEQIRARDEQLEEDDARRRRRASRQDEHDDPTRE